MQNTNCKDNEIKKNVTNVHKTQKKATYLDDYPEWDYVKSDVVVGIPIIKNGNLCGPIHINKLQLVIRETCAFDSILQIVMCAFASHCTYKTAMMNTDNPLLLLAQDILQAGKLYAKHYTMRGQILSDVTFFERTKYSRHISMLNTNSNVAHLAEHLFRTIPSCTKTKICNDCKNSNVRQLPVVYIDVDIILRSGLSHIQRSIEEAASTQGTCTTCNKICIENIEYGSQIMIDLSILTDDQYIQSNNIEKQIYRISDVQSNLRINNKTYLLAGIISYKQYTKTGHYAAYTNNTNRWYKYDDMHKNKSNVKVEEIVTPHLIMYVQT